MKLTIIAAVVASAGIAQIAATPIRIVIAPAQSEGVDPVAKWPVPVRHAIHYSSGPWNVEAVESKPIGRRPCHGRMNRIHQKGIEISNAFRKALGLPLIETDLQRIHMGGEYHGGNVFSGGFVSVRPKSHKPVPDSPHPHDISSPHHRHHRLHHHGFHGRNGPFTARLHHSLMHLGRWEGRAVAFVLGCGIGVLLRMFWVLAIVTYRAIKGQREDEPEYSHFTIIEEYEETPLITPPPTYIYPVDEKVALKEDEVPQTPVTTGESK